MRHYKIAIITIALFIIALMFIKYGRNIWYPVYMKIIGGKTVQNVINDIGLKIEYKLEKYYADKKAIYPPEKIILLAYKDIRMLELWSLNNNKYILVKRYKILSASGKSGPKLMEGDRQVPEGIYNIEDLNPNSSFHLSLELNYPNEYDINMSKTDGRTDIGNDIGIHGSDFSVGCLAIGNDAIEELFILVAKTGKENVKVIIAPNKEISKIITDYPQWIDDLYSNIKREINNSGLRQ